MKTDPELAARIAAAWQRQAERQRATEPTPTAEQHPDDKAERDAVRWLASLPPEQADAVLATAQRELADLATTPEAAGDPAFKCDRCPSRRFVDVAIHDGESTRRDCAECGRFAAFTVWYGEPTPRPQDGPGCGGATLHGSNIVRGANA